MNASTSYWYCLTLIPTAFKMSSFPRGGADSAPPIVTIVDGLPYSPNCAWCKAVMLGACAGYFCLKKIEFVALAIKISSYIIFELWQNLMNFVTKSHRWRVEIINFFVIIQIYDRWTILGKVKKFYKASIFTLVAVRRWLDGGAESRIYCKIKWNQWEFEGATKSK